MSIQISSLMLRYFGEMEKSSAMLSTSDVTRGMTSMYYYFSHPTPMELQSDHITLSLENTFANAAKASASNEEKY